MSFRRKTYDGDFVGRGSGSAEWRNSFYNESQANQYASPRRTRANPRFLEEEDQLFREDNDKDRYLITYADLITLLLGLFILLYAISNIDLNKYEKFMSAVENVFGVQTQNPDKTVLKQKLNFSISSKATAIDNLKMSLQSMIGDQQLAGSIKLEENERGITVHILDDILFTSGAAELNAGSQKILHRIASIIGGLPNDIRIEGHTDNIPMVSSSYPSNWHLSVARALNTAYYLIEKEGLGPGKVSIVGYSEYHPVGPNDTPAGRSNNRRVDIVILKQ